MLSTEHGRLLDDGWRRWGPYLAERAWGTVREDYSASAQPWQSFPHDHARSRTYRWSEDGLGGICDDNQLLCLAFAFWNERDPILKERLFGLTGPEGNHGEDAKEYWWYLDSTPTHSWMRWRYAYPQPPFPYAELVAGNRARGKLDPEFELADTGVFDQDRYWDITADYAKADPDDMVIALRVVNRGPEAAALHVLPTLWFRNTWSWGLDDRVPIITEDGGPGGLRAEHHQLGSWVLTSESDAGPVGSDHGPHGHEPVALFCDNESNAARLWGIDGPDFPKDGINDHVVDGRPTVNPERQGTKAAIHHRLTVGAGETATIRLRLRRRGDDDSGDNATPHNNATQRKNSVPSADLTPTNEASGQEPDRAAGSVDDVLATRQREADEFYQSVIAEAATDEEAMIARQAYAGMLWTKQFYHFDVERWLDGDPAQPPPPPSRRHGRNSNWRHLNNHDIISMPDCWEYPWYAAWDLAFHCVPLACLDPELAKRQLLLLCREWYMHPDGQLPAYEWSFGDVNPPVHAWAALQVFDADGGDDYGFLERIMHKLLLNFTWWVNRKDEQGDNVFEGGFLGLDNIGPIDRSAQLPDGARIEQSDGTAWMAMYSLNLLEMALRLAEHDPTYEDIATKFFEHFTYIANAMNRSGLWDDADGFYYDVLHLPGGEPVTLKAKSMVGLLPLAATATLSADLLDRLPNFAQRFKWFLDHKSHHAANVVHSSDRDAIGRVGGVDDPGDRAGNADQPTDGFDGWLLSIVSPRRLVRILGPMLDEEAFLSPYGLRSLSREHRDRPFNLEIGAYRGSVGYEPAESQSGMFGGNSNWRGPVWFPVNYLLIRALDQFHAFLGSSFAIECPTGSGAARPMDEIGDELTRRLVSLFLDDGRGWRPVFGDGQEPESQRFQNDPRWHDQLLFHEYFQGDNGRGLGASHQTGWTGLIATLINKRHE